MTPNESSSAAADSESNREDTTDEADDAPTIAPSRRSMLVAGLAAMSGSSLTGSAMGASSDDSELVVDDYEDETAWTDSRNNLDEWTGGNSDSLTVNDGTLRIDYDDGGWFVTTVSRDVSQYDRLVVVARGETGAEGDDLTLSVGESQDTLAALSGDDVGDTFAPLAIDLNDLTFDESDPGVIRIDVQRSVSPGVLEIDEIRFDSGESKRPPEVVIYETPDQIAVGEAADFEAATAPGDGSIDEYAWDFDDGTTATGSTPSHTFEESGTYEVTVTVTDENGLTDTETVEVTVQHPPQVLIYEAPDQIVVGDTAEFQARVAPGDGSIDGYEWDFDDGTTATGSTAFHSFEESGTYEVTVTVTDENGYSDSASVTVTATVSDFTVEFETTFTRLDEPNRYEGEVTLQNPGVLDYPSVEKVTLSEPFDADTVVPVDGFTESEESEEGDWVVTDDADAASITFEYDGFELLWTDGIDAGLYKHSSAAPEIAIDAVDSDATVEQSFEVDGEGYTYPEANVLFFGEYEHVETTTDHGPLTLTVPAETSPSAEPELLLQGMAELSAALDTGPEHDRTNGFVTPVDGPNDRGFAFTHRFQTKENQPFARVNSVWLHEWTHITDDTPTFDESARWLSEAYADYYAALLPLEIEHGPHETEVYEGTFYGNFKDEMADGVGDEHDLRDNEYVDDNGLDYSYGALVIGSIDREIRATTDDSTFEDVFDRLHRVDGPTHEDLLEIIADVADEDVAAQADAWITAEEYAEPWSTQEHEDAFGYDVPDPTVETTLTAVVDGERQVVDGNDLQRISIEDPIHVDVTITNHGSADGSLSVDVVENTRLSDRVFAERDVRFSRGTSETETIAFSLEESGHISIHTALSSSGQFDGPLPDNTVETEILALPSDATLVRETDETSRDDPATVATDEQLALLSDVRGGDFSMEQVDGDDALEVPVGDDLYLGTIAAAELEPGATYAVEYVPSEETQYVEVI